LGSRTRRGSHVRNRRRESGAREHSQKLAASSEQLYHSAEAFIACPFLSARICKSASSRIFHIYLEDAPSLESLVQLLGSHVLIDSQNGNHATGQLTRLRLDGPQFWFASSDNVFPSPFGAGGGIRTHEPLRDRVLSPAHSSRVSTDSLTWLGNPRSPRLIS
jgi:hypothetical protein